MATCLVAGLTCAAFWLLLGNGGGIPWLPPTLVFSLVALSLVAAGGLLAWWQAGEARWPVAAKVGPWLQEAICYLTAFNIACFGWKKLFGLQFIVPPAIASQPMNQQSGEWLTWYYFGYSPTFGLLLALIQLAGAGLLLFRATRLLGAVILTAFLLNLTLIDICYHLNAGAVVQAVVATLDVLFIMWLHYARLLAIFLPTAEPETASATRTLPGNLVRISAILLSLLFTFYLSILLK
ncbi:hypothetical protein [Hymenobacter ginkgonis]|nr:hypothetical protein [Hymenobacter ginkgonis]